MSYYSNPQPVLPFHTQFQQHPPLVQPAYLFPDTQQTFGCKDHPLLEEKYQKCKRSLLVPLVLINVFWLIGLIASFILCAFKALSNRFSYPVTDYVLLSLAMFYLISRQIQSFFYVTDITPAGLESGIGALCAAFNFPSAIILAVKRSRVSKKFVVDQLSRSFYFNHP